MMAKGSAIRQDVVNKAKAFDEKHQFRANASARVTSFDKRVGLTEKFTVGISVVSEKVKSVDQRLHVSDKTMTAILAAERKISKTGSAVKSGSFLTRNHTVSHDSENEKSRLTLPTNTDRESSSSLLAWSAAVAAGSAELNLAAEFLTQMEDSLLLSMVDPRVIDEGKEHEFTMKDISVQLDGIRQSHMPILKEPSPENSDQVVTQVIYSDDGPFSQGMFPSDDDPKAFSIEVQPLMAST